MIDPDIDDGYDTPYAKFLEREIEAISDILRRLILDHGEHKPIDSLMVEIEEWMGDDWYFMTLSEEDQKRLDKIKGWTYR